MALNEKRSNHTPPNETGVFLSGLCLWILIGLLGLVIFYGIQSDPMSAGRGTVLMGLYIMVLGFMYLASYYFSHKALFLRVLMWHCEHASVPAGRKMAFFYFLLAFVIGLATLLSGLGII